jgi:hypothetical protein
VESVCRSVGHRPHSGQQAAANYSRLLILQDFFTARRLPFGHGAMVASFDGGHIMHWIDPTQLPQVKGIVERFLLNSHGELDGLILVDGTEVHFPPHLSTAVGKVLKPGAEVVVYGLRPRRTPVVAAVALDASGHAIVDEGPNDDDRKKLPRTPLEASGKIVRTLHGPKGETRGALLDDGTIVRIAKHGGAEATALLAVGQPLSARGEGVATADGRCIEAHFIGPSTASLKRTGGRPHKEPKSKESKDKRPEHREPKSPVQAA